MKLSDIKINVPYHVVDGDNYPLTDKFEVRRVFMFTGKISVNPPDQVEMRDADTSLACWVHPSSIRPSKHHKPTE